MHTAEEAERHLVFHRACGFLVQAEALAPNANLPAILCSAKAVLCALAGVLLMKGIRCGMFATGLNVDIGRITDDRVRNLRDAFFAEFVATRELDDDFGVLLQAFLEHSCITRLVAESSAPPPEEDVRSMLTEKILPWASEIVGTLVRFSGHDPLL